jgi:manganese-dependent inorganic pyrophosphatase
MQTIVIGHRNPDMDAICSAIAYTDLKRKLGMENVTAARAGNTNERIDLVLQKFGVPAPEFLSDVAPKVEDVMETQIISIAHDSSIYHAMNSIETQRMRGLPVVDAEDRCLGLLSGWKVSQYLFPQRDEVRGSREIFASISDIVRSFDGEFIIGGPKEEQQKDRPRFCSQAIASTSATYPPVTAAVLVPPSACSTSQSMMIVFSPSAL